MSDGSIIGDCCAACFGICCLACCESILVSLNFRKPGSPRTGSTQRGCCRDLGESTEDDQFEENARRERMSKSSKNKNRDQTRDGGNGEKNAKENEEDGGDKTVREQPAASPVMTTEDTPDDATKT